MLFIQEKLHIGHVREVAKHELDRIAADERYRCMKAEESAHLASVEATVREIEESMAMLRG